MAGGDPLGGLYDPTPEDYGADPTGGMTPRLKRRYARYRKYLEWKKRKGEADAGLVELESAGLDELPEVQAPEKQPTGMLISGREATQAFVARKKAPQGELLDWIDQAQQELLAAREKGFETEDDINAYFEKNLKLADYLDKLYEDTRSGTVEGYKGGKLDAQALNERLNLLLGEVGKEGRTGGMKAAGKKIRDAVAKQQAAVAEAKAKQQTKMEFLKAKAEGKSPAWLEAMDPTGAIRGTLNWQPVKEAIELLTGPAEAMAGIGGLASETLGVDYSTPVGAAELVPDNPITGHSKDSPLRQRGREFLDKFGEATADAWEQAPEGVKLPLAAGSGIFGTAMTTIDALENKSVAGVDQLTPKEAHDARALVGKVSLELAIDPLNVIDFGPGVIKHLAKIEKAVLRSKPFLKFAAQYPKMAYAPSKFVRYVTGHAKDAMAMGDEGMMNVVTAERSFTEEAGYEFFRLRADALEAESMALKRLEKPLHAKLADDLPRMVEMGKDGRMAIRETVETDDVYKQTLLDAADAYDDLAARAIALEKKWGMKTQALTGDFSYFGRQFSDELLDFLAKNKTAQHALFGEQVGRGKDGLLHNLQAWEKHRKMRGFDFYASEERLRKVFSQMGYASDKPIWSRDAFGLLAKRAEKSFNTAKVRKLYLNYVHEFGVPVADNFVDDAGKAWSAHVNQAGSAGPVVRQQKAHLDFLQKGIDQEAAEAARRVPEGEIDIEVFHGTNRQFDEMDVGAERIAIKDKPGRGDPVRGMFFSPDEQVARNYVDVTLDRAVNEAIKGGKKVGAWGPDNIAAHYRQSGLPPEQWAAQAAREMLAPKRGVIAWISNKLGIKPAKGIAVLERKTAQAAKTGKLYDFAQGQERELAEVLARAIADDPNLGRKGLVVLDKTDKLAPRVLKQRIRGKSIDLTNAAKWPEELVGELRDNAAKFKAGDKAFSEDARVWKVYQEALSKGKFRKKNVIERSPALNKFLKKHGYDVVKKPENDEITGAFSYWVLNQKALRGADEPAKSAKQLKLEAEYAKMERALAKADRANPENWDAYAKAGWVKAYRDGQFGTSKRHTTALDVLLKANAELPDDIGELARLAGSHISNTDALKLERYMKSFYWHHLDSPEKAGKYYDAWKRIFQRAVLARFGSANIDNIGSISQGMLAGNVAYINDARKALGGNHLNWAKGAGKAWKVPDDVARAQAEGWLRTTKGEALEGGITFENRFLKGIEEKGILGGMLPGRAGKAVGKFTDMAMHRRVWVEEVNRLATYRKAIAEGMDHKSAVEEVYLHFGKFDELTKLERTVLSRMFFFWSWMQRSMPITVAMMFEHPVRMRLMLTAMAGDSINEDANQAMPEWLRRMGGWVLGQDDNGNADIVSTGRGSYAGPLFSFLQGDMMKTLQAGDYEALPGNALREVARASPPFVQAVPELAFQKDMFTNKDWWKDQSAGGGSNMKAPSGFYWLMDPKGDKPTFLQELLGLKAEYNDKTGEFQRVTMNPYWSWLLDALPGVAPVMADASAYADPRSPSDLDTQISLGGDPIRLNLGRGTARQMGFPIYHVQAPDTLREDTWKMREALVKDVNRLSSGSLIYMNGQLVPNKKSLRGKALKEDRERWRKEAVEQGMPHGSAQWRQYVRQRIARKYTDEYRLMELADRLDVLVKLARDEEPDPIGKGVGIKLKSPEDKLAKQAERETKRKLAKLRGLR